jgi:subtilisin family serine protease
LAHYDHLQLVRLPEQFERRKHGGGGPPPERNVADHSGKLESELAEAINTQRQRRKPEFVDPNLILRVQMSGPLMEADWDQLGLTILSSDPDRTLVLFSSTEDMAGFRARLAAYRGGPHGDQKHPPYNSFVAGIEAIGAVEPKDRIGVRFREAGIVQPTDFVGGETYIADIELWDVGRRDVRERKIAQLNAYVIASGGEALDQYIGPSITMLRVRGSGQLLQALLTVDDIAAVDAPPEPDLATSDALKLTIDDLPKLDEVPDGAPIIGIIDSGINAHPLLNDVIAGAIGVPANLGTADDWGHGTRVGSVATFGDLRAQLQAGTLSRVARLCSAKVVNAKGAFDDRRLVPSQMREAISTLHERYGCRIFVLSLGDRKRRFDGGKVGNWAATLDELARELDILIVVSAGNAAPPGGARIEMAVTDYPAYMLAENYRLVEPAGAVNVLTVGALAHGEGLDGDLGEYVNVRPITRALEPSPMSRVGPGVQGGVKPDLVDMGGTLVFDPVVGRLRDGAEIASAGVLTLHHKYADQLLTAASGTSYAAPKVAFCAAQLLSRLPNASANLLRALLVLSAEVPDPARDKLAMLGEEAVRKVCGHGLVDAERAAFSDDARVVLYADDELAVDHFAVYRIPIPVPFQSEKGERRIRVVLAYDPPVRHTRNDYTGIGMSFRLVRGCNPDLIFEHYRKRAQEEGPFPELATRFNCSLEPGPQSREKGVMQSATAVFKRDVSGYGDDYYLVVRCEGGWAQDVAKQPFAAVVEISHRAEVQLYERIRQRIRV